MAPAGQERSVATDRFPSAGTEGDWRCARKRLAIPPLKPSRNAARIVSTSNLLGHDGKRQDDEEKALQC